MEFDHESYEISRLLQYLGIKEMSKEEVLEEFIDPSGLRARARGLELPCSYKTACRIMIEAGWVPTKDFILDPRVPATCRNLFSVGEGAPVLLSKFFACKVGDTIERDFNGKTFTATVKDQGRLFSPEFGDDMTPTSWARKVQGRGGHMPIGPKTFWRKVRRLPRNDGA